MQSFGVPNTNKQDPLVNANKVSGSEINIKRRINCRLQQKKKKVALSQAAELVLL